MIVYLHKVNKKSRAYTESLLFIVKVHLSINFIRCITWIFFGVLEFQTLLIYEVNKYSGSCIAVIEHACMCLLSLAS